MNGKVLVATKILLQERKRRAQ